MTPKNSDKCPCGCNYPDHWKQRVEPVAEPQSSDLPGDKCKHGIFTSECDECDGPTFEGNDGLASSPSIDAPSCLICGHIRDRAIWHESGVYVCKECVDKVRAPERSIDVAKEAREWWAKHQDDFVKEIRGAGLDTHSLYDTPKAIAAFFEYMTGERS